MQISTRTEDFIIDTLELRSDLYILNEPFTDPAIVKVSCPVAEYSEFCQGLSCSLNLLSSAMVSSGPDPIPVAIASKSYWTLIQPLFSTGHGEMLATSNLPDTRRNVS